jgi:hypothetical protein
VTTYTYADGSTSSVVKQNAADQEDQEEQDEGGEEEK